MDPIDINLKNYGLHWEINTNRSVVIPTDYMTKINNVNFEGGPNIRFFGVKEAIYKIGHFLGGGTYGSVYECERTDGLKAVMKITKNLDLKDVIKEVLIQIIIFELTKRINHPEIRFKGPYCPFLYDFAYNQITKEGYIVSQKMENTIEHKISSLKTVKKANLFISKMLIQLSTILKDLNKIVKYNHRDLKPDNCMFILDKSKNIQVRLIDFGFSYLKYGKLEINANNFIFNTLQTRDMSQFLYALYLSIRHYPDILLNPIKDLLTFPIYGTICKMYEGCDKLKEWKNSYNFLNTDSFTNPNGDPDVVKKVFINIYKGIDYKSQLAYTPGMLGLFTALPSIPIKPPDGFIYNPDTGKYVKIDGVIGRALMKQMNIVKPKDKNGVAAGIGIKSCKEPTPVYNPKTYRCVMACPPEKYRNKLFRCVAKTKKAIIAEAAAAKDCKEPKPVYNPTTDRCVMACPPEKYRNKLFRCVTKTKKVTAKKVTAKKRK